MVNLWDIYRKALLRSRQYESFHASKLNKHYANIEKLLKSYLIEFKKSIVPAHHAPDGPFGGLKKSTRSRFGNILHISILFVGADDPQIPNGPIGDVLRWNLNAVTYSASICRVI